MQIQIQNKNQIFLGILSGGSGPPTPSTPVLTIAPTSTSDDIGLSWTQSSEPDTTEVYRSQDFGVTWVLIQTVAGNVTEYFDTDGMIDQNFWIYRVRGILNAVPGSYSNLAAITLNFDGSFDTVPQEIPFYPSIQVMLGNFDISDSLLPVTLNFATLAYVDFFIAFRVINATSFSAPLLVSASSIRLDDSTALASVNLHNLTTVGSIISFSGCGALTSLDADTLDTVGGDFDLSQTNITHLSLPAFGEVDGNFIMNGASFNTISIPLINFIGGDLSCDNLTLVGAFSLPSLAQVNNRVVFDAVNFSSGISLPVLTQIVGSFRMVNANGVTSLDLSSLATTGQEFLVWTVPTITSLITPALQTVGGEFQISGTALTSASFPSLVATGTNLLGDDFSCSHNPSLVSVDFSVLFTVDQTINVEDNAALTSLSFPVLNHFGEAMNITTNPVMASLSFGDMSGGFGDNWNTGVNAGLVTLTMPNIIFPDNGINVDWHNCALSAASVNLVLARCRASGDTSNIIDTSGGTSAAPTGQGVVDKAFLQGAGNSVTTN